jgi:hypothetical protein
MIRRNKITKKLKITTTLSTFLLFENMCAYVGSWKNKNHVNININAEQTNVNKCVNCRYK